MNSYPRTFGLGAILFESTRLEWLASTIASDTKALQGPISSRMGKIEDGATLAELANVSSALSVSIGRWNHAYTLYLANPTDDAGAVLMDTGNRIHAALATLKANVNTASDSAFMFYLKGTAKVVFDVAAEVQQKLAIDPSKILGQAGWVINNAVPLTLAGLAAWFIVPKIFTAMFTGYLSHRATQKKARSMEAARAR